MELRGYIRDKTQRNMSRSSQEEDVDRPTFAVEDDVLPGRADVCVDVQAVSFIQLTRQTASWEQSHRFHTEETRCGSPLHRQLETVPPPTNKNCRSSSKTPRDVLQNDSVKKQMQAEEQNAAENAR